MTEDSPIRVLVCDDQDLVRAGFVTVIRIQPDMTVVGEAADGRTAVEAARRLRPDVVVMDVRMPGRDGIEATRMLAGPDVTDPMKILVVTTFNLDKYVYAAIRAGASGFLLKDAAAEELVAGVRTVAAGESLLSPSITRQLIGRFGERIRATPSEEPVAMLTEREREVLRLVAEGLSNAEIAAALVVSHETVKTHVSRVLTKLGLRDRVQAVVFAHRNGLVAAEG